VGQDGEGYRFDLGRVKIRIFLHEGLDRKFSDLPVGQLKQPVRQQIVGWVEPFAKPIAVVQNMMGIASFHPSYALESVMRTKAEMPTTDQGDSNSRNRASSTMCSADKTAQAALEPGSRILGVGGVSKSGRSAAQHFGAISKQEVGT
jgi:hypothetical protein